MWYNAGVNVVCLSGALTPPGVTIRKGLLTIMAILPSKLPQDKFCCVVCQQEWPQNFMYWGHNGNRGAPRWLICQFCAGIGKHCATCKEYKLFDEFVKATNGLNRGGVSSYCKTCKNIRNKHTYNPEQQRDRHLRTKFKITQEEYDLMFFQQAGMCAVCGKTETRIHPVTGKVHPLCVDHNHETGQVRQLLCYGCNALLGHIERDRTLVKKLEKYLKKHDQ